MNGVFPGAGPNFVTGLTASSGRGFGGRRRPGRRLRAGPGRRAGGIPGARPAASGSASDGRRRRRRRPADAAASPAPAREAPAAVESTGIAAALRYVKAHGAASRFGLIVQNEQEAAAYVIKGEPVASMGGFTGRETVLTNAYLARLVRDGEARYFLLGADGGPRGGPGGTSNAAVSTIESACTAVSSSAWPAAARARAGRCTTAPARPLRSLAAA